MEKSVKITIKSVHITPSGDDAVTPAVVDVFSIDDYDPNDTQRIDVDYEGVLRDSPERLEVEYAETTLTGMEGTTTCISYEKSNPGLIIMSRAGTVSSMLCFEAGERIICSQSTDEMALSLVIDTAEVRNALTSDGGEIKIAYGIEFRGSIVERTVLIIEVRVEKNGR